MNISKAHFIGISGVGMSATAKLLQDIGVAVTGSDENVYPPVSDFLARHGIPYKTAFAAENIPADADVIVIGKTSKLVPGTNSEVAAAYASGKQIRSFPEILAELSKGKETIVVAGSYGKSTSTALLSHCLQTLPARSGVGADPSFFIGAIPLSPPTSARMGSGQLFLLEGDEYPSSNTDERSKFLHYNPQHLIITPLAHDHFNVFPTPSDYLRPFEKLIAITPPRGIVVGCIDGPLSRDFFRRISRSVITYGTYEGDFHAAEIELGETTRFSLVHNGSTITRIQTTQLGEHNIQNAVGVGAFLHSRGLLSWEHFAAAVATFRGIKRRLDKKSEKTTIPIFEGFGSSYDKARSAIAAVIRHFPDRRLIVVFEPHTFSWRNRDALFWYDDAFSGASKVYIYEPSAQGAETHAQASQVEIVQRVRAAGFDVEPIQHLDAATQAIDAFMREGDVILLLTSGDLGGLIESIQRIAERKFPK